MNDSTIIIRRLLRTEKGLKFTEAHNKYYFDVHPRANKIEIKKAVQDLYKVKVRKVNTEILKGKPKRVRMALGYLSDRKKAVVTLVDGQKIDITT